MGEDSSREKGLFRMEGQRKYLLRRSCYHLKLLWKDKFYNSQSYSNSFLLFCPSYLLPLTFIKNKPSFFPQMIRWVLMDLGFCLFTGTYCNLSCLILIIFCKLRLNLVQVFICQLSVTKVKIIFLI